MSKILIKIQERAQNRFFKNIGSLFVVPSKERAINKAIVLKNDYKEGCCYGKNNQLSGYAK